MLSYCIPQIYGAAFTGAGGFVDFNTVSNVNANNPALQVVCSGAAGCFGATPVYGTTGLTEQYAAYGTATYGILNSYASGTITGTMQSGSIPSDFYSVIRGDSLYNDTVTVAGGAAGTPGTENLTFTVTGFNSASGNNIATGYMFVTEGSQIYGGGAGNGCSAFNGNATVSCSGIPIVFGQPVSYEVDLWAVVNLHDFMAGSTATSDFAHTAVLTGISVNDQNGNPVPNFSITAASGTAYTRSGVTPEPEGILLCAAGLILIGTAAVGHRQFGKFNAPGASRSRLS